ncbi:bromodomain and PHD finger-containing protein [Metarhizium rileyi]|uniref:Bromodomain and PHD finger-containing protein n=1 Tax=Metarhizium rileyi (strain RCEF 4871) TaxID=1649241 RepID=A0A166WBN4_METRR|nr:bromodomain and PHD finger-containing protein [Metarhizium rileyi RCEF 4871]
MAPASSSPRRTPSSRPRGRPLGSTNAARAARQVKTPVPATEPPPKRRRYAPGGPGGGGRFVETDELEIQVTTSAPRSRTNAVRSVINGKMPRRERNMRSRASASAELEEMRWGSAAAVAASVKQAEDYKPREERSWEEFHPNLDIEQMFMIFSADEVDGIMRDTPSTPALQTPGTPLANGTMTPSRHVNAASTGTTPNPQGKPDAAASDTQLGTPSRRPRRPTREVVSFYTTRPSDLVSTPRTPKILPIQNQTPKEKLDLKLPSYRRTNRIELFESKTFGQARYVDKAMSNVGYQESDQFIRPDSTLIKAIDTNAEEDLDLTPVNGGEDHSHHTKLGKVEYDMDEQDDMWLEHLNSLRKQNELETITREVFEITITKIEKEWHALEKKIPKPNPKPPQTHRPRSGSAAAVNGETQSGEEPDSKCAICDDGDCENTNAIVFCDGCNLAVHQECYGVPFIPEGQWLCRKCQLCGRGIPTCIFCPNTDGAFKQTNSSKWAHLLCAMWVPEVSLGNHTFMEPVMDVEKVPKTRWKLSCYICRQKMGACIQCSNKNCYQAFHVTCARRARLYLKMKTSHGALAVLDGSMILKAFCDKHCPLEYGKENNVHQATRSAKKFYKRNMKGRIWADNLAMANVIAAQQRNLLAEAPASAQGDKERIALEKKKNEQPPKNMWKLPSGAPIIPQAVFDIVEASIQRFPFRKRKDFLSEACRYWTLKREARRGAGLLKRLQLQMETFSSMELTRRDFSTMGPNGKARLARRIEFAGGILEDLKQLKDLSEKIVHREQMKVDAVEIEDEFVNECYFPVAKHLPPAIEKAISLDKDLFTSGLANLQSRIDQRFYVTTLTFAQDLGDVISTGIMNAPSSSANSSESRFEAMDASPIKTSFSDIRERRKLGKRILKAVQPLLETALRVESEVSNKSLDTMQKELENIIDVSVDTSRVAAMASITAKQEEEDTIMVDAPDSSEITVKSGLNDEDVDGDGDPMDTGEDAEGQNGGNIEVNTSGLGIAFKSEEPIVSPRKSRRTKGNGGIQPSETPPESETYVNLASAAAPTTGIPGPPTPPHSNGSFGKEPPDPLTDGGVLWYFKTMQPRGTSILGEHWAAGRDAVRMLSEELTDLDDEELKGLRAEVDESVAAGLVNGDAEDGGKPKAKPRRRKAPGRRR